MNNWKWFGGICLVIATIFLVYSLYVLYWIYAANQLYSITGFYPPNPPYIFAIPITILLYCFGTVSWKVGISLDKKLRGTQPTKNNPINQTVTGFSFCPYCGKEIPNKNHIYCPFCGKKIV